MVRKTGIPQIAFILLLYALTPCGAGAHEPDSTRCTQKIKSVVNALISKVSEQQKTYWKDVVQTRGRRLVLVERKERERFQIRNVLDPLMWPVTLPPEILKTRYTLSYPAQIVASFPIIMAFYGAVDHFVHRELDDEKSQVPGAEHGLELAELGLVQASAFEGFVMGKSAIRKIKTSVNENAQELRDWSLAGPGSATRLRRLQELRSVGVFQNDAQLQEFALLAQKAYLSTRCPSGIAHCPPKISPAFWAELQSRLASSIDAHPVFSKQSVKTKALLMMVFIPSTQVSGKLDLLRLKESPLFPESFRNPAFALYFDVASAQHPEAAGRKASKWSSMFGTRQGSLPAFVSRPDLPGILSHVQSGFDLLGTGNSVTKFDDELSLWRLAWKDPRFADIREGYLSGVTDEYQTLEKVIGRINGFNAVYSALRAGDSSSSKTLCRWLNKGNSNPVIAEPVQQIMSSPEVLERKLTSKQTEVCSLELANVFAKLHEEDLKGFRGESAAAGPDAIGARIEEALRSCPSSSRACEK